MSGALPGRLDQCIPKMYRVALRIVGRAEEAEEVVQEACLKATRAASRFDGRSTWSTWLHSITVNCARDRVRREKRNRQGEPGADRELPDGLPSPDAIPPAHVEQIELYQRALAELESLPEQLRDVFVLTQLDGYSYEETAGIAELPRGTVASRVARAKRMLIEGLGRDLDAR